MSETPLFFTDLGASSVPVEKAQYSEDGAVDPPRSAQTEVASISSQQIREKRLFLPDSDDETIPTFEFRRKSMTPLAAGAIEGSGSDLELPSIEEVPHASSVSSMSSMVPRDSFLPRITTPPPLPPAKKRRLPLSTQPKSAVKSDGTYLRTFLVPGARSTVKGKGYIKPGEGVRIEKDSTEDTSTAASVKGKMKQLTLRAMLKAKPIRNVKRKTDTVV